MLETLPDFLKPGLDIVFIGLNPSTISVTQGHYFANPRNRFWKALNMSGLIPVEITHEFDSQMLDHPGALPLRGKSLPIPGGEPLGAAHAEAPSRHLVPRDWQPGERYMGGGTRIPLSELAGY